MTRLTVALAVGAFVASGSASAKEYGEKGVIDISGNVGFESVSRTYEDKDVDLKTDESETNIEVAPSVFYYLADGLPIVAEIGLQSESEKDNEDDSTSAFSGFSLAAGAGYLMKFGKARIGPVAQLRLINETTSLEDDDGEAKSTRSGTGVRLAGVAKLPIGSGGAITAALVIDYESLKDKDEDLDVESDVTRTSFGTIVGVSVWF